MEIRYTMHTSGSYRMPEGEHWDKRLSAAQRRFTRACESLAKVRRLALPASRPGQMPQANVA
ncbi:MAG TPA: hypothetical protein VGV38_12860 [Pyrinomonadaceae bacterium]|nr:hypothetical protein [Pyrinomonadaceae bacterium]